MKEHFSELLEDLRRNLILMGGEVDRQIQGAGLLCQRPRPGYPALGAREDLSALLSDRSFPIQNPARHGVGPGHRQTHRPAPRRLDRGGKHRRAGERLPGPVSPAGARIDGTSRVKSPKVALGLREEVSEVREVFMRGCVLVVEDDPDLLFALSEMLESEGYQVACARHGLEALGRLRGGVRPSLILLDLMMPIMNGWQFRYEQRQDSDLARIPVVVVSAKSDSRQHAEWLEADAYLSKPIDVNLLLGMVDRYCSGS